MNIKPTPTKREWQSPELVDLMQIIRVTEGILAPQKTPNDQELSITTGQTPIYIAAPTS